MEPKAQKQMEKFFFFFFKAATVLEKVHADNHPENLNWAELQIR